MPYLGTWQDCRITFPHTSQVELSVGRPHTLHGNVHQVDHVPNGPTDSTAITTMFPLRLCGGKPLVVVTRERRCAVRADCALTTTTQFTLSANNSAFSSSQLLQGLSEANASPAYSAAIPSLVFLDIKGEIRNVSQSRQKFPAPCLRHAPPYRVPLELRLTRLR